jgi:hypothetical protein
MTLFQVSLVRRGKYHLKRLGPSMIVRAGSKSDARKVAGEQFPPDSTMFKLWTTKETTLVQQINVPGPRVVLLAHIPIGERTT